MKFKANLLPTGIGSMPHQSASEASSRITGFFPEIPFWPQLPRKGFSENMYVQFAGGLPGLVIDKKNERIHMSSQVSEGLEEFYQNVLDENHDAFPIGGESASGLYEMRNLKEKVDKSLAVKGQITGPVSFGLQVTDENRRPVIYNDVLADLVVKNLKMKAGWQECFLRKINPSAKIMVFFDEPYLSAFGSSYINLERSQIIGYLNEVFSGVKEGLRGVHCCGNTDFSLLTETSVDIISFDAYSYSKNLALYAQDIRKFLSRGGIIAWGIAPTSEEKINFETVSTLVGKLEDSMKSMVDKIGLSLENICKSSLITPSCGVGTLSTETAEKILKTTRELSDKLRLKFGIGENV